MIAAYWPGTDGDDFVDACLLAVARVMTPLAAARPNWLDSIFVAALISQGCLRRHGLGAMRLSRFGREGRR